MKYLHKNNIVFLRSPIVHNKGIRKKWRNVENKIKFNCFPRSVRIALGTQVELADSASTLYSLNT